MAGSQFVLRGAAGAFATVLATARGHGLTVTRAKLAHLLYLADLRAVSGVGGAASGLRWRWFDHGVSDPELLTIEDDLVRDGTVERVAVSALAGDMEHFLLLPGAACLDLDANLAALIERTVLEHGGLSPSELRDLALRTEPVLEAQHTGSMGDLLDLLTGRPVPDISPSLRRLSAFLDRLDRQANEGDLGGLADEISSWADYRARATDLLLTDE